MFNFLTQSNNNLKITPEKNCIYAPVSGVSVPLACVNDQMFSRELLGKGLAIKPDSNVIYAPVSGTVAVAPKSCHAVALLSPDGLEVLVHIGINTVELKGKYFKRFVSKGDNVKAGQKLIEFDREKIKAKGYDVVTPIIITNSANYLKIHLVTGRHVLALEKIAEVQ